MWKGGAVLLPFTPFSFFDKGVFMLGIRHMVLKEETSNDLSCQWHNCEAPASKHVDFGHRHFGDAFAKPINHLQLCDVHSDEIRRTYQDVTQRELAFDPNKPGNGQRPVQ